MWEGAGNAAVAVAVVGMLDVNGGLGVVFCLRIENGCEAEAIHVELEWELEEFESFMVSIDGKDEIGMGKRGMWNFCCLYAKRK